VDQEFLIVPDVPSDSETASLRSAIDSMKHGLSGCGLHIEYAVGTELGSGLELTLE
jgi:hypothetical protein